jgi:hypothetical protein
VLTFESPVYDIGGIVVFRDHESPSDFHYLAGPPHITRNPDGPVITMLTYRNAVAGTSVSSLTRDQLGGGFLMLGVDCGLSETQLATIKSELSGLVPDGTPEINLSPVLYTRGTVNIIALDYQQPQAVALGTTPPPSGSPLVPPGTPPPPPGQIPPPPSGQPAMTPAQAAQAAQASRFVRGVIGTSVPSLMDDLRAIFSLALTPDAAVLIENAYSDDLSPIGVMYYLEFTGLSPALSVKAHGDKKKIYDHLKLAFHAGYTSGSAAAAASQTQRPVTQPAQRQSLPPQRPPQGSVTPPGGAAAGTPPAASPGAVTKPPAAPPAAPGGSAAQPGTPPPAPPGGSAAQPAAPPPAAPGGGAAQPGTPPPAPPGGSASGPPGTTSGQPTGSTSVALAVDIGYEVEKMVQDETITIEIVREVDGQSEDATQTQAMDLIKQVITNEFFTPAMSNAQAATIPAASQFTSFTAPAGGMSAGTAGTNRRIEVGFQLQYKQQEELGSFDVDFSLAAPQTRVHAPNGFFSALLSDVDKATHIKEISLDDVFFRQIDVTVSTTGDLAQYDIESAVVDLQHGGTVDAPVVAGSVEFTPSNQVGGHFVAFPDAGDYEVRHRVTYDLGDSPDIAGQPGTKKIITDWAAEVDRALVVHPSDDISIRGVFVEPGVVDWDVIDRIETTLTYADPGNSFTTARTYIIGPTSTREEWRVRLTNPAITGYTVQHRWHLKDGQRVIDGKPTPTDIDHLYVPDPFVERLPITVSALVDKSQVARVDVQLSYQDDGNDFSVTKMVEVQGPNFVPVTVEIPLMDSDVRSFSYVATLVRVDGSPQRLNSVTTDSPSVFVSDGHFLDVAVTMLGSLAAAGLDGVQVDLRTDPADGQQAQPQSVLFQQGSPPMATVRLTMRPDRGSQYQYQTTAFLTNGAPVVRPWASANTTALVLQPARLASAG